VLLSQPLSSTANDNLLVRTSGLAATEGLYLWYDTNIRQVSKKLDQVAIGGQAHYWSMTMCGSPDADSNEGDSPATLLPQPDPAEERNSCLSCRQPPRGSPLSLAAI